MKVQETSSTRQQPITKSLHVEGSTQEDIVSKGKSLTAFTSCHVSNISNEDATTNIHISVNETKDKVVDLLKGEHSDGWDSVDGGKIPRNKEGHCPFRKSQLDSRTFGMAGPMGLWTRYHLGGDLNQLSSTKKKSTSWVYPTLFS